MVWLRMDLQGRIRNQDGFFGAVAAAVLRNVAVPAGLEAYAAQVQSHPLAVFSQCEIVLSHCRALAHPVVLIDDFEAWLEPDATTALPFPTFFNNLSSLIGANLLTLVIASRPDWVALWSQAGRVTEVSPTAFWWDTVPPDEWPDDPESRAGILCQFEGEYGDRRQELVFIGRELDENAIRGALDACLLTDAELNAGPEVWLEFPDPLPKWSMPEEESPEDANGGEP